VCELKYTMIMGWGGAESLGIMSGVRIALF